MIWAGMSSVDLTLVAFVEGNMDSAQYCKVLGEYLLPFANDNMNGDFDFQQDNAPVHTSTFTTNWFSHKGIKPLKFPKRFPDLNTIKNLWGIIARDVYNNGQWQFLHKLELKAKILKCLDKITVGTVDKLVDSMTKQCTDVLQMQGGMV